MPYPSNTEFDSDTPDSSTPSTSEQPTMKTPPADIEHDTSSSQPEISSTSGQPTMKAPPIDIEHGTSSSQPEISSTSGQLPLSSIENNPNNPLSESSTPRQPTISPPPWSIEHDPDNHPPENQPSQNKAVSIGKDLTFSQRVNIQLPLWKEYFCYFWPEISISMIFAILAVVLCFAAYGNHVKNAWLAGAWASSFVCFCIIWLKTKSGPPFISEKDGSVLKPVYLRRKVTTSDRDLRTRSQKKQTKRDQMVA